MLAIATFLVTIIAVAAVVICIGVEGSQDPGCGIFAALIILGLPALLLNRLMFIRLGTNWWAGLISAVVLAVLSAIALLSYGSKKERNWF